MTKIDPEALRLDNQLCFAFYATLRAVTQAYRPLLDALGLTYPQYLVLLVLWETDQISVTTLGERLFLDSGTLTPLLKRMESRGIIRRVRNATDERQVLVCLTAAGRKLKSSAAEIPEQIICKVGFPRDRSIRLRTEIRALLDSLNRVATESASPNASKAPAPAKNTRRQPMNGTRSIRAEES
jgi:MarR family transcriptional regulator, organic hydroperoxide resistance regulator